VNNKKDNEQMLKVFPLLTLLCVLIFNCGHPADRETLTQVGTIDALLGGVYDGEFSLRNLTKQGDFGLGTFNTLNGEMIVLDGKIYQVTSDGKVALAGLSGKTPMASVTYFDTDREIAIPAGTNFNSLIKIIDDVIPTENIFYAIRIEGKFSTVRTRSVPAQSHPYKPLVEIAATQPEFDLKDVAGTIVGFRCPPYVAGINVPGYHLHFLSTDKKSGGHLLAFTTAEDAVVQIDDTHRLTMILPHDQDFYGIDLATDKQTELEKVEK
jgi:acetolactate decarboxylase